MSKIALFVMSFAACGSMAFGAAAETATDVATPLSTPAAKPADPLELPAEEGSGGCSLSMIGGTSRPAFEAFDVRLRAAAASGKAATLAQIVAFPLKVNHAGESKEIATRKAFLTQATSVFTPAVRAAIQAQKGFFCRDIGLSYGAGAVWVKALPPPKGSKAKESYAVYVVNVPDEAPKAVKPKESGIKETPVELPSATPAR